MSATLELPLSAPATPQWSTELWISFASLLRSHVAMHSIARPHAKLRIRGGADSDSRLEVLGPGGKLVLLAPNASGTGVMEFRPPTGELGDQYDTFFFTADGLFHLAAQNVALDMEAAVEDLLRKVQA